MPHSNIIAGNTEDEIWETIAQQLNSKDNNRDYTAQFTDSNYLIDLDIDIHPEGGDENGKQMTSFSSPLPDKLAFRFKIQNQHLKHTLGKLFGMQDVIVGHPEFDKKFLIQTNEPDKVKQVLTDEQVTMVLLQQPIVVFEVREHKIGANKHIILGLDLDGVITDPATLKTVFRAFKTVLSNLQ